MTGSLLDVAMLVGGGLLVLGGVAWRIKVWLLGRQEVPAR